MASLIKKIGVHKFFKTACRKEKECSYFECNKPIKRNVDYVAQWRGLTQVGSFHDICGQIVINEHTDRETRMVRINKEKK